jgi:hypothetical protein
MKAGYEITYAGELYDSRGTIAQYNFHRLNKVIFLAAATAPVQILGTPVAIFKVKPIEASPASRAGRVDWDSF